MTRLLVLFEYASLNGGERSWLGSLDSIRAAGFDVTAAGPSEGPLAEELARRDVPLLPLSYSNADGSRRALDELRISLKETLSEHGTELLHANSLSTSRISGPVAAELGVPSIGHLRDIIKLSRAVIADINCHTRLLAVSRATRDFHIAQGLEADRVEVTFNGVDLQEFRPRSQSGYLHNELNVPRDAPLIAAIGQVGLRKGFDVLLEAAAQLAEQQRTTDGRIEAARSAANFPAPHFLIIGERHSQKEESVRFEEQLHAAAAKPLLAGHVHFLSRRTDIAQLLPELSLLVHPARQEPLGRVLLEAAACGLPIIATKVGGTAEIFPAAESGAILVPADDAAAICQAMLRVLADRTLAEQLGTAGRERMEQVFDHHQAADRLIDHYRALTP